MYVSAINKLLIITAIKQTLHEERLHRRRGVCVLHVTHFPMCTADLTADLSYISCHGPVEANPLCQA